MDQQQFFRNWNRHNDSIESLLGSLISFGIFRAHTVTSDVTMQNEVYGCALDAARITQVCIRVRLAMGSVCGWIDSERATYLVEATSRPSPCPLRQAVHAPLLVKRSIFNERVFLRFFGLPKVFKKPRYSMCILRKSGAQANFCFLGAEKFFLVNRVSSNGGLLF